MKNLIDTASLLKITSHFLTKTKEGYQLSKRYYQKLSPRQRLVLLGSGGLIILLLMVVSVSFHSSKPKLNTDQAIQFANPTTLKNPHHDHNPLPAAANHPQETAKLQRQLDQLTAISRQQFAVMEAQWQAMQAKLSSLASLHDVQQLQQQADAPHQALLGKVEGLQSSLQKIAQQTARKTWVNPNVVESYFRLAAVQGFSDGLRAIVDIDGNQTVLSLHEHCPACRGWVLQQMDFANQSAVFAKQEQQHTLYVKLHAN